jgi:heat shock protein HtpX
VSSRDRDGRRGRWRNAALHAVLLVWSLWAAANGHLVLGLAAATFFALLTVLTVRIALRTVPPPGDGAADAERLRALITELCRRAGCPVPQVRVAAFAFGTANARVIRRRPVITVSRWLVRELPDAQLAAILAHELSHLVHGDCRVIRRRRLLVLGLPQVLAGFAYTSLFFDDATAPIVIAALTLAVFALTRLIAPWQRPMEERADREAVRWTGDPEAVGLALGAIARHSAEERQRLRGRPPLGWLLAPLVAPAGTHPSPAERVAAATAGAGAEPTLVA